MEEIPSHSHQKLVNEAATGRDRPQQDVNMICSAAAAAEEDGGGNQGSSFDCKICLDSVRDPVVTSCGHLFCWPCLYRWLHARTGGKECPVCKRKLTVRNVTPIYGHGNHAPEAEDNSGPRIPLRPHAHRAIQRTSTRHNPTRRTALQRRGSRFDLTRNSTPPRHHGVDRFMLQRAFNPSLRFQILSRRVPSIRSFQVFPPIFVFI